VERRGAAPVRRTKVEEATKWGTDGCFQKKLRRKREGVG
jgi:hypothetical protein